MIAGPWSHRRDRGCPRFIVMCGIAAFFSSDKRISVERLKRATSCLHHRGPDSQGAWLSPNQRVGLGHARLRIIDLTTGDQPIANEDEQLHIVVNGEFNDFERQRRELERRGHVFRTRSDSEIALHLYEEFGAHCVQQLRGECPTMQVDGAEVALCSNGGSGALFTDVLLLGKDRP